MKKLTYKRRQEELDAIAAIPDDQIDLSDIAELTADQLSRAVRGQMYRPVKKPVTMRLDADVIAWLKEGGPGYQTKANSLLRKEMIRSFEERKRPARVPGRGRAAASRKVKNARAR
jgi:uncharacterized protein (DUF4415 family)